MLDYTDSTPIGGCHCPSPTESAAYRGHTITVHQDLGPINPFKEGDSEPPTYAYFDRYGTGYGLDLDAPELTRDEIKNKLSEILSNYFERDSDYSPPPTLLSAIGDDLRQLDNYCIVEAVNEKITEYIDCRSTKTKMELLVDLYALKGIIALSTCVIGYSQGQYTDLLIVATPEWLKATGAVIKKPEDLQSTADLYGAWAYGDVYGYVVTAPDGKEVDSCWGFYGTDHDKNGLEDHAKSFINYSVKHRRAERFTRIKTMIRNHVPLSIRAEKLHEIAI